MCTPITWRCVLNLDDQVIDEFAVASARPSMRGTAEPDGDRAAADRYAAGLSRRAFGLRPGAGDLAAPVVSGRFRIAEAFLPQKASRARIGRERRRGGHKKHEEARKHF